ncbi:MAG: CrcB family protein [Planctomycetota bacterium]
MRLLPAILWLALGGAAGTLVRVGLSTLTQKLHGGPWPAGTLAANALGCLLFGLVFALLEPGHRLAPAARLGLLAGFCGALTTFSTYAFDTAQLARGQAFPAAGLAHALLNLLLHNAVGFTLLVAGLALGARLRPAA